MYESWILGLKWIMTSANLIFQLIITVSAHLSQSGTLCRHASLSHTDSGGITCLAVGCFSFFSTYVFKTQ
uniref:Putative secreted protein n=1 Tax=Ixodes ricinus TaxID=34613 RepID=A0A6B0TZV8_IXORI